MGTSDNFKPIELDSLDLKYKKAIESLIEKNSNITINNSGPSHASIIISNIFKHSHEIVRIYANSMNGEISKIGNYLEEFDNYLNSGKILKVFLDKEPKGSSPAYKRLKDSLNGNIEFKLSTPVFRRAVAYFYTPETHFITGDNKMFRNEYDNYNHQALCGFNNPKPTEDLINLFDKYF